jgi:BirA family biotin operon repressor/biotin-[acetyl-CoA-carboxylase] ligase
MEALEVFDEIDSTNSYLLQQTAPAAGRHRVAVADHQTAGRGRHSRAWISAPGSSLCLSVAYTFDGQPENLPGLTLAIGVAARDALAVAGVDKVLLKWPNDLVADGGKLGGMLAETHIRSDSDTTVVAGIGINVDLPKRLMRNNTSSWSHRVADLAALATSPPTREVLAALLVNHLVESLDRFARCGIGFFVDSWRESDWLRGRDITVEQANGRISGIACGIDDDGALLLHTGTAVTRIITGSISLDDAAGLPS